MSDFQVFLSSVASRLRHDLKGGLISLRLGLEAISDEETLKPLLLERAQDMESLADKLILLLRMGELRTSSQRPVALLRELENRAAERFPELTLETACSDPEARWVVDGDALVYALFELVENSALAGATTLSVTVQGTTLQMDDDGEGLPAQDLEAPQELCQVGISRRDRSGLGLAIAQQCALGHGGELTLGVRQPRGARVTLDFPGELLL